MSPSPKTPPPAKSHTVLGVLVGVAVGAVIGGNIGYQIGTHGGRLLKEDAPAMPPPGMQGQAAPPQEGAGAHIESMQRIQALEQLLAKDPKNVRGWIQLGNDYFDTHQAQKSVDAYQRALDLGPADPDVLTDQGVMYRDLGQFDRAIANFKKASELAPTHVQSLFNMGIVYSSDLHDAAAARQAFEKVIQTAPQSPQAAQAQEILKTMTAGSPAAPPKAK